MNDEFLAGPIEVPQNSRPNKHCCPAMTEIFSLCEILFSGIWLGELFLSAIEKTGPSIRVSIFVFALLANCNLFRQ